MQDLRILFDTTADTSYHAQLADAEGRRLGVAVPFTPFLTENDYEDLRWYLEEYMDLPDGGAVTRAQRIEKALAQWGRQLYDTLFTATDNLAFLTELLDGPEPRRLTIATRDPALLRLPWELMADEAGSLAQRLSVRRQLEEPKETTPRPAQLPLRILYIVSRPADTGFLDPRLTAKALFDALDPLGASVRVDFCRPPTLARMDEMLRDEQRAGDPYDLVHFDGHGTFLPHSQIGALLFEKPDDGSGASKADLVTADRLGDLLASYDIPLVVLEACRSATVGKAAVFRSVAPRLIHAGVDSVLSMGHAVHVEAARLLLDRFYRELVRGNAIGQAVAEARKALRSTPARWIESGPGGRTIALSDWFLPHLYQRAADDALVPSEAARQKPVRQFDVFLSHQHNDATRVEALARQLTEKHGLRVWLDKWECGPGKLESQCEVGIQNSRFTVVAGSQAALQSRWVQWEIDQHLASNPEGDRLIPIKLERLYLPPELDALLWVDCTNPAEDADAAALLARLIRGADAEDTRRRRGFRSPATQRDESGPFPPPPQYGFQGRARELYELERRLRSQRGIVLHAMGGMGKTALATEAAHWWTRSGLFRDGACFLSFEQFASADRAVQVLGTYLAGPKFEQLPAIEQRRRVIELFQQNHVLMVWDNFESALPQFNDVAATHGNPYTDEERVRLAELFRDLTTDPGKGCLLVTCRPGDTGLPGAQRYELEGLARADSLWLLASILRRDGLTLSDPRLSRDKLDPLLRDLADHPLSLELVGPHLRTLTPEVIRADFGKLLAKFQQEAPEGRNQSLLASLEFSRRHLSPVAREALPWLGLFGGGVFEQKLLELSQIAPEAWEPIRRELQGIALLRVEDDLQINGRPFLRFHPTLAAAAADPTLAQNPEIRQRFLGAYLSLMQALDKALAGSQSRAALEVLSREEANYRTAVQWAVADQQLRAAAELGETFSRYLQRSSRLRERDAWVQWLKDAVGQQGFTEEAAAYERQHAWTRLTQGDPQGAVDQLQALIERLRNTTDFDPAFQLAVTISILGRVLDNAGTSAQAVPILREAAGHWEALVEKAGGRPWEELLASPNHAKAATELGNLSATMGDLANALSRAGQHDEALSIAEKCVEIQEKRGNQREVAAGQGLIARIFMAAGRFDEADDRYYLALAAARQAGDKELEGTTLQNQGGLADDRNQIERASRLYQQALERFREAGDQGSMMRTYNLLGVAEQKSDRLAEARAWYEKSRELAVQLKDQVGLGQAAQNIGIVWQVEGEAARERGDEPVARRYFEEARRSVEESLRVHQVLGNKPDEAASRSQLAQIHLRLGDLAAAERHAHEAQRIHESFGLKEALFDYHILSEIAQARGDLTATVEWERKRDYLRAELERRSGDSGSLPDQTLKALQTLALACAQAGFGDGGLGPAEEEALAQLDPLPNPFPAIADFLRRLAGGEISLVPNGLPHELGSFFDDLLDSLSVGAKSQPEARYPAKSELALKSPDYVDEIIMSACRQGDLEGALKLCSVVATAGNGRSETISLASIRRIQIGELYHGYSTFESPSPPHLLRHETAPLMLTASWVTTVLAWMMNLGGFPDKEGILQKTFTSLPSSQLDAALRLASNALHDILWPEVWDHPSQPSSATMASPNSASSLVATEPLDWADNVTLGYQRLVEGDPDGAHRLFAVAHKTLSSSQGILPHLALRYLIGRSLAAANRVDEALDQLRALVPEACAIGLRVFVAKVTCDIVVLEQSILDTDVNDSLVTADRAVEEAAIPLGQANLSFRKALLGTNTNESWGMWSVAIGKYLNLMKGLTRMRRELDPYYMRNPDAIPQVVLDLIQPSLCPTGSIRVKRAGAILYRQFQWIPNFVEINRETTISLTVFAETSERHRHFLDAAHAWTEFADLAQYLYRSLADECGMPLLEAGHHYRLLGSLPQAEEKLSAAQRLLKEKNTPTHRLSCRLFFELGCLKESGDHLRAALSLFKDAARCCPTDDKAMLAQLTFRQARLLFRLGYTKQGADTLRKLIVFAEKSESSEIQELASLAARGLDTLQVAKKG